MRRHRGEGLPPLQTSPPKRQTASAGGSTNAASRGRPTGQQTRGRQAHLPAANRRDRSNSLPPSPSAKAGNSKMPFPQTSKSTANILPSGMRDPWKIAAEQKKQVCIKNALNNMKFYNYRSKLRLRRSETSTPQPNVLCSW